MSTDFDTARTQYDNYRYCYVNGHEEWVHWASMCFKYWRGEQWDRLVRAQLEREGRPAMTFNITESLIRAMTGMQRALRNDVRYLPMSDASLESARVMDAVWLHIQQQNRLEFLETDVYKKGLIMDRAYYEVKLDFSESLTGTVAITSLCNQWRSSCRDAERARLWRPDLEQVVRVRRRCPAPQPRAIRADWCPEGPIPGESQ